MLCFRPNRQFVPASERYPAALQRNRQESRLKRQAELLALQERTCLPRTDPPLPPPPQELCLCPDIVQTRTSPTRKVAPPPNTSFLKRLLLLLVFSAGWRSFVTLPAAGGCVCWWLLLFQVEANSRGHIISTGLNAERWAADSRLQSEGFNIWTDSESFFLKFFLGGLKISEKKVCAVCNQKA